MTDWYDDDALYAEAARRLGDRARPATRGELHALVVRLAVERDERMARAYAPEIRRTGRFLPCLAPDAPWWDSRERGHPCVGVLVSADGHTRRCTCPCHHRPD